MGLCVELKAILSSAHPVLGVLQGDRRLTKGLAQKWVNFHPSLKTQALMPTESRLEADYCLLLDFAANVPFYYTQPFSLDLGAYGLYTPDAAFIDTLSGLEIREVKFSGALEDPELDAFFKWLEAYLAKEGIGFRVITEKEIQKPPRFENLKYLYRVSHLNYDSILVEQGIQLLMDIGGSGLLGQMRTVFKHHGLPPLLVDRLLLLGHATFDLTSPLTSKSHIRLKEGAE